MSEALQHLLMDSDLCGESGEQVLIDVDFDYGEVKVTIRDVPAVRCPDFDEDLIPGPIGVLIGDLAAAIARESLAALGRRSPSGADPLEAIVKMPRSFHERLTA